MRGIDGVFKKSGCSNIIALFEYIFWIRLFKCFDEELASNGGDCDGVFCRLGDNCDG